MSTADGMILLAGGCGWMPAPGAGRSPMNQKSCRAAAIIECTSRQMMRSLFQSHNPQWMPITCPQGHREPIALPRCLAKAIYNSRENCQHKSGRCPLHDRGALQFAAGGSIFCSSMHQCIEYPAMASHARPRRLLYRLRHVHPERYAIKHILTLQHWRSSPQMPRY